MMRSSSVAVPILAYLPDQASIKPARSAVSSHATDRDRLSWQESREISAFCGRPARNKWNGGAACRERLLRKRRAGNGSGFTSPPFRVKTDHGAEKVT
jgi:hypothetical protein